MQPTRTRWWFRKISVRPVPILATEYIRLLREQSTDTADCIFVEDTAGAVEYLKQTEGNVLLTTGSKELKAFTALPDFEKRLYARVLSTPEVATMAASLGFVGKHLICMQGPFSKELNTAMLKQFDAAYLVTKDSGKVGGFEEKLLSATRSRSQSHSHRPAEGAGHRRKILP